MWDAIKTICLAQTNWIASCVVRLFLLQEPGPNKCLSRINCSVCLPSVKLASAGFRGNKACNALRRSFRKLPRPEQIPPRKPILARLSFFIEFLIAAQLNSVSTNPTSSHPIVEFTDAESSRFPAGSRKACQQKEQPALGVLEFWTLHLSPPTGSRGAPQYHDCIGQSQAFHNYHESCKSGIFYSKRSTRAATLPARRTLFWLPFLPV